MRENLKYYFTSIAITLMLVIFAICFVVITGHAKSLSGDASQQILQLEKKEDAVYRVTLLGQDYELSFEPLKKLDMYRKSYFTVTPAPIRLIEQGVEWVKQEIHEMYEEQKKQEFEQNTAQDEKTTSQGK